MHFSKGCRRELCDGGPKQKGKASKCVFFFFPVAFSEFRKFVSEAEQGSSVLPVCSGVNWFLFEIFTGWEHQWWSALPLSAPGEQALTGDIPEQLKVSAVQSWVYFRSADLKIKRFMYRPKSCPALLFSFGFCGNVSCELFNIFWSLQVFSLRLVHLKYGARCFDIRKNLLKIFSSLFVGCGVSEFLVPCTHLRERRDVHPRWWRWKMGLICFRLLGNIHHYRVSKPFARAKNLLLDFREILF